MSNNKLLVKTYAFFLTFFVLGTNSSVNPPDHFNIGVMFPIQKDNIPSIYRHHFAAIVMAFEDINNKTDGVYDDILPTTELRPAIRSPNNGFYYGAYYAKELLSTNNDEGIKAVIGPAGSLAMQGAAPTFKEAAGIPVIGYADRSSGVSNSLIYSNVLRPVPPLYYDGYAIASLISKYFLWDRVTVFSDNSDDGRASNHFFSYYASQYNIRILSSHLIDTNQPDFSVEITTAKKSGARIFILFLSSLTGSKLISQGIKLGLFQEGNQIIGGERMSLGTSWEMDGSDLNSFTPLLKGFIGVKYHPYAPTSQMKSHFLHKWIHNLPTNGEINTNGEMCCDNKTDFYGDSYLYQFYPNGNKSNTPVCSGINFTSFQTHSNLETELNEFLYAYDATITAALGLHHLIYEMGREDPSPSDLMQYLLYNTSFIGLTGKISFMNTLDDFNLGGRESEIVYEIVNFIPPKTINSTQQITWKDVFPTVISWHSENGFTSCHNRSFYFEENPCFVFHFNTPHNTLPLDSPPPTIQTMPTSLTNFLVIFASFGLFAVTSIATITYLFRERRLVRMSQPIMTYFSLGGVTIAYFRLILTTFDTTEQTCLARIWFDHLGYQLIFTTLLIRSWRVYLVAGTMKRTKVSDLKSSALVGIALFMTIVLLFVGTFHSVSVKYVTVTETQFEYILQPACSYGNRVLMMILYAFDTLIFIATIRYCWTIRKVLSTICNTAILVEALVTALVVICLTFTIVIVVDMEPLTNQFLTSLVIGLLVSRMMWIFQSQLLFNLLFGYELDRALILRKTEKSLFDMNFSFTFCKKFSIHSKILSTNIDESHTSSITNTHNNMGGTLSLEDQIMTKGLEKYGKLKNKAELDAEIERVKEEIKKRQIELICLENMIFASEQDSKSQSGRRSSQGQGQGPSVGGLPHSSRHSQIESCARGGGGGGGGGGHMNESGNEASPSIMAIPMDSTV